MKFVRTFLAVMAVVLTSSFLQTSHASALSGSDFKAGRIIDQAALYNGSTMNAAQVQAFLNAKVPVCDTAGSGNSNNWNAAAGRYYTRAEWGSIKGSPAPFTCLRDYRQNVPAMAADRYCAAMAGGNKSAAEIIVDVGKACSFSPQAMIVLLQKEQSLISDDWPWPIQYTSATGYGCPDTAACNPEFNGFFYQVYYGARQYQLYAQNPGNYSYKAGRANRIQYNPNASCGASSVVLNDQATASLYNYTPYQPNDAALKNLYGTGDSCSAYGNRNFWRMYNDWFGSPYVNCKYPNGSTSDVYRMLNPNTNGYFYTSDPYEVCSVTASSGYVFDGIAFAGQASSGTPVYRLVRNGNYLYTTSSSEISNAVLNYGFTLNGVGFYGGSSASTATPLAVYRLAYPATGTYFYTVSSSERDNAVNLGFRDEGVAFYTQNQTGLSLQPIYRLSSGASGYLFTPSDDEKQSATLGYNFSFEGTAFNSRLGFTADNLPVYRLASKNGYLLTTSFAERKFALQHGYRAEDTNFYAYPSDFMGATVPVYRLVNQGRYFYTSLASERDAAVSQYGYTYEGVAFRLP